MNKTDFEKTPQQVRGEIEKGIEDLHRQLMAVKGHSEKGNSSLFKTMFLVFVLLGQFAFAFVFENKSVATGQSVGNIDNNLTKLNDKEVSIISAQLSSIDDNANIVKEIKQKVAPNMQIDANIGNILSSTRLIRQMTNIGKPKDN